MPGPYKVLAADGRTISVNEAEDAALAIAHNIYHAHGEVVTLVSVSGDEPDRQPFASEPKAKKKG